MATITGNFLDLFIQANKTSSIIAGQLFFYNSNKAQMEIVSGSKGRARKGLQIRYILIILLAVSKLGQILNLKYFVKDHIGIISKTSEINLCIVVLLLSILAAERYRVRGWFPQDYVAFINGTIQIEKSYGQGNFK